MILALFTMDRAAPISGCDFNSNPTRPKVLWSRFFNWREALMIVKPVVAVEVWEGKSSDSAGASPKENVRVLLRGLFLVDSSA